MVMGELNEGEGVVIVAIDGVDGFIFEHLRVE